MSVPKIIVPAGRLDVLAAELLKQGVRLYGNPALRIALKMGEGQLATALTETLGPGTKAGEASEKFLNAAREFERKYQEAVAAVAAEGWET